MDTICDLTHGEIQRRMKEYENPGWGYRRSADGEVEKMLFDGDPPEGWADSPDRAYTHVPADATSAGPTATPPPPAEPADTRLSPPYDQYSYAELRAEHMRRMGKGVKVGTSTQGLIDMMDEIDASRQFMTMVRDETAE